MKKKIFILCGEPSGDFIASKLVRAIFSRDSSIKIEAVCGDLTETVGVTSIFPIKNISVMGFAEVIPKLPMIIFRLFQAYTHILKFKPDVIVTIDYPGFNFTLVKMLRKKLKDNTKFVNYVAPSVWAYKPERVNRVKKLFDHQILILPFEKQYFDNVNMPSTYVGHPIFEDNKAPSLKRYKTPTLAIMPGSRISEIKNHSEIFASTFSILKQKIPSLHCIVFTLPHLKNIVKDLFQNIECDIISSEDQKEKILPRCTAAIVKSGTSSLEVLKYNVPMVVAYKVSSLSAWYIKKHLNIPHISIANIIADKELIPELLQENCSANGIASKLLPLLHDSLERKRVLFEYNEISDRLSQEASCASDKAAELILQC